MGRLLGRVRRGAGIRVRLRRRAGVVNSFDQKLRTRTPARRLGPRVLDRSRAARGAAAYLDRWKPKLQDPGDAGAEYRGPNP